MDRYSGSVLSSMLITERALFRGWSSLVVNLQGIVTLSAQLEVLKALIRAKDAVYSRHRNKRENV